jgi:hypothetical protein
VGVPLVWKTMVQRVVVSYVVMIRWLPLGPEGPIVGGAPPPEGGPGDGALEAP